MRAVHLESGRVEVRDVPTPDRPKGFALIRLLCAGICNTDLELQRGYYDFKGIPGHEFAGVVEQCDTPSLDGRRVVGEINIGCDRWDCEWCVNRIVRHCPERTVLGILKHPGAFAEFLTLPEKNLHVLPDSVSTEEAVFVEPLAAARHILDQVDLPRGTVVAVLGDGKLGLLIAMALQSHGARVHQFGRHRDKLEIAERVGVSVQCVDDPVPEAQFDYVVEATGSPEGLRQAVRMARPKGVIVMKSTTHETAPMNTAPLVVNEILMMGSRCGRFQPAIELLGSRKVGVTQLISERMSLNDAPRAFETAARKGVLKVLLTP